jgi:putative transposase
MDVAGILAASSRRGIGWALARSLAAELALAAVRMARAARGVRPGLVHHSDRGVPYAAHADTHLLTEPGIRSSMRRTGHPDDHAQAERFIKTLQDEASDVCAYYNLPEARERIGQFIEEVYHEKRLHLALGYRPPTAFERLFVH